MDTLSLLRTMLRNAHRAFQGTVGDVTPDDAQHVPPGMAHPIGSRYAHLVIAEDYVINRMLQNKPPLFETSFKDKTGVSETTFQQSLEWARRVKIDLPALGAYAEKVFGDTEKYFDSLMEADLSRSVDLSEVGYGQVPLPVFLSDFVVGHVHDIMGEISATKGMLGKKGYPF